MNVQVITNSLKAPLSLFLGVGLALSTFAADKQLKSVALTVGDLGNPFFLQIQHGVESKAKEYNPNVKITSLSSNYDVNNQTNQMDDFVDSISKAGSRFRG